MFRLALRWFVVALAVSMFGAAEGVHLMASLNDPIPAVLEALHANADAPSPRPHPPARPVVVVLIDGLGADSFNARLGEGILGAVRWRVTLDSGVPSRSRPVYHAILTGLPQWAAGIRSNHYLTARADGVPARVRAAGGKVAWMLESVPWFYELFGVDEDVLVQGPVATTTAAFGRVWDAAPDLTVLHLTEVDDAGHLYGADSAPYVAAGKQAMETVAAFRRVARERAGGDRAIWLVGADHGHTAYGGHGGPEQAVRRVSWIALYDSTWSGEESSAREAPPGAAVTSLAPTIARALGVDPPLESMATGLALFPGLLGAPFEPSAARVEAASAARIANDARPLGTVRARGVVIAALLLATFAALTAFRRRRGAAEAMVFIVASAGFLVAGPGLSMSSVRTEIWYLAHGLGALTLFAVAGWVFARRWASPFVMAAVSAVFPVAALLAMRGSLGLSDATPVETVLVPSLGLVPASVCTAIALVETWVALRSRRAKSGAR